MGFIDVIKERAKAANKTIVLPETEDRRTYEAAAQILKEGIAKIILVGSEEAVKKGSEGLDLTGAVVVDPATSDRTQAYIDKLVELRQKKGMTPEQAVMIGDSNVDIRTAKNASVHSIGCTWGFRGRDELAEAGADDLAEKPEDLLKFTLM